MIGNTVGRHEQEFLDRQADKAKTVASFDVRAEAADNFLDTLDCMLSPTEMTAPAVVHRTLSGPAVSPILKSVFPSYKH